MLLRTEYEPQARWLGPNTETGLQANPLYT